MTDLSHTVFVWCTNEADTETRTDTHGYNERIQRVAVRLKNISLKHDETLLQT